MPHTIQFRDETLSIRLGQYPSGNTVMRLVDANGLPYMTVSVNPPMRFPDNWIAVKNYSENQGILEALVEQGIVEDLIATIEIGHADANLCKLLINKEE